MAAAQFGKESMDEVNIQVSILLILPFRDLCSTCRMGFGSVFQEEGGQHDLAGPVVRFGFALVRIGQRAPFFLGWLFSAFHSVGLSFPCQEGYSQGIVGSNRLAMAVGWTEMLAMVGILGGAFVGAMSFDALVVENGGWNAALILALGPWVWPFCPGWLFCQRLRPRLPRLKAFKPGIIWSHFGDLRDLMKDRKLRGPALGDAWFWSVGGFFYLVLVKLSGEVVEGGVGLGAFMAIGFFCWAWESWQGVCLLPT